MPASRVRLSRCALLALQPASSGSASVGNRLLIEADQRSAAARCGLPSGGPARGVAAGSSPALRPGAGFRDAAPAAVAAARARRGSLHGCWRASSRAPRRLVNVTSRADAPSPLTASLAGTPMSPAQQHASARFGRRAFAVDSGNMQVDRREPTPLWPRRALTRGPGTGAEADLVVPARPNRASPAPGARSGWSRSPQAAEQCPDEPVEPPQPVVGPNRPPDRYHSGAPDKDAGVPRLTGLHIVAQEVVSHPGPLWPNGAPALVRERASVRRVAPDSTDAPGARRPASARRARVARRARSTAAPAIRLLGKGTLATVVAQGVGTRRRTPRSRQARRRCRRA